MAETPTSQLEAVNTMLSVIGIAPINSLNDTVNADVALAVNLLTEVSRKTQGFGWDFNSETEYPMSPDLSTGNIALGANILRFDGTEGFNSAMDLVERGRKVYDRANRTFTFTQPIKADVILFLPFEDLPEAARHYITIRAARQLADRTIGATEIDGYAAQDEMHARMLLEEAHADTADLTIFNKADQFKLNRYSGRYS